MIYHSKIKKSHLPNGGWPGLSVCFYGLFSFEDIPNDDGDPDNAKDDVGDIGIDVHVMDDRFPLRADSRAQVDQDGVPDDGTDSREQKEKAEVHVGHSGRQ